MALDKEEKADFETTDLREQERIDVRFRARLIALKVRSEEDFLREAFQTFKDYLNQAASTRVGGYIQLCDKVGKQPTKAEKIRLSNSVSTRSNLIASTFSEYCHAHAPIDLDSQIVKSIQERLDYEAHDESAKALTAFERFTQHAAKRKRPANTTKDDIYAIATFRKNIKKVTGSDGEEYEVLPFSLRPVGTFFVIEQDDIKSEADLQNLIEGIFNRPEAAFYYYTTRDGKGNPIMESAFHENRLVSADFEYGYYKNPKFIKGYDQIHAVPEYEMFDWQKDIVNRSPEQVRITLRLTEAQKRELEKLHLVRAFRDSESNSPINFKPRALGWELDGIRSVRLLRRYWPQVKAFFWKKITR